MPAVAKKPAIDAVLTTWPASPASSMRGRKLVTPWMTPHRSTPSTHSQSFRDSSATVPPPPTPALLHNSSTLPKRSNAAAASASTWSGSETSQCTSNTSVPSAPASDAAASARPASSTSASTTCIPSAAARRARASPMPLAAPVTTAVPRVVCIALRSGGKCKDWPMQIAVVYASRTGNTRRAELVGTAIQDRGTPSPCTRWTTSTSRRWPMPTSWCSARGCRATS